MSADTSTSTPTDSQDLLIEEKAGLVRLTLNRPQKRNALSFSLLQELDVALSALADSKTARVVVLAANGPVFCSGHDLKEMTGREESEYLELFTLCSKVMLKFRQIPQPVIAKVHGMATAAGCQMVAACDLAVASESALFATPGVKIGLFCSTPMVPLVRNIAPKKAMEMLLTGKPISAPEALQAGLVNQVVDDEKLDEAIQEMADSILVSSPLTLSMGKKAFYDQLAVDEETAYSQVVDVMTQNMMCHDAQEGITAFLEKRSPEWRGC